MCAGREAGRGPLTLHQAGRRARRSPAASSGTTASAPTELRRDPTCGGAGARQADAALENASAGPSTAPHSQSALGAPRAPTSGPGGDSTAGVPRRRKGRKSLRADVPTDGHAWSVHTAGWGSATRTGSPDRRYGVAPAGGRTVRGHGQTATWRGIPFLGNTQKRRIQGHNEIRGARGRGRGRGLSGGTRTFQG